MPYHIFGKNGKMIHGAAYDSAMAARRARAASIPPVRRAAGRRLARKKAGLPIASRALRNPSRNPMVAARQGKGISEFIARYPKATKWGVSAGAGMLALRTFTSRTGHAVDPVKGRPTGIFGF